MQVPYNTIYHDIRIANDLSIIDWCILEAIHLLSTSGKERYKSWCNADKKQLSYLAKPRTLATYYNKLEACNWIEFKDEKRYLKRTTEKYVNLVWKEVEKRKKNRGAEIAPPMQKLHDPHAKVAPLGVQKLHDPHAKVAPHKKNNEKNIKKNIEKDSKRGAPTLSPYFQNSNKGKNLDAKKQSSEAKKVALKKVKNQPAKSTVIPPPHINDLEESRTNQKTQSGGYTLGMQELKIAGTCSSWSEDLLEAFEDYCKMRDARDYRGITAVSLKALARFVNKMREGHPDEKVLQVVEYSTNGQHPNFYADRLNRKNKQPSKKSNGGDPSYMLGLQ